jgi:hypothetical protein
MWYQSKIKYKTQDDAGKWKSFSESFLHDGVSFTDVEAQLYKILEERLKTDFEIGSISKVKFEAVYDTHIVKDGKVSDFYKVTVLTKTLEDKLETTFHLVAGFDVTDAEKRAETYMKDWMSDTMIISVAKSPILGVWHQNAAPWQEDFKFRMEKLAEEGRESSNINQIEINFTKNPDAAKDLQEVANNLGAKITVSAKKNGKTSSKTIQPKPAEAV